ncbi:MAG TPA: response regulator [Thermoanaerobaculia bacterium]|jgi:signal transduction histidine kinase
MTPLRALLVEDSEDDALLLVRELQRAGYDVSWERIETADAMRAAFARDAWDVVFADYNLPHFSAPAALAELKELGLDIPVIVVSGSVGEEIAAQTMKAGAHDFILKGNFRRLIPAVERELEQARERRARRQAEEQLRQSQKMEAIGQLAGGVAHDFNNLLTAILGYAEFLATRLREDPAGLAEVEEIRKAGERAASLTRQLLAFSRRQVLEPKVLDLNAIVRGVEKMLNRLIEANVDLVATLDPSLSSVHADAGQIEQVIMNLVVNARDAMPRGGKLTIETANVELDEAYARQHAPTKPGHYVMLAVSDSGLGMDAETQSHIFEPFFTTKEQGKGTGLGLSTVYGIVQQSGGHIWVYSEPGRGTTFKVYLPRVEGTVETAESPPPAVPVRATETILLVEDDEALRRLALKTLQGLGYTVLDAGCGSDALDIARRSSGPVDLILTDVVMPEMSAAELTARLRRIRPQARLLYMSGYTDEAIVRHDVLAPGTAFLQKPFTPASLARKVREVLTARE